MLVQVGGATPNGVAPTAGQCPLQRNTGAAGRCSHRPLNPNTITHSHLSLRALDIFLTPPVHVRQHLLLLPTHTLQHTLAYTDAYTHALTCVLSMSTTLRMAAPAPAARGNAAAHANTHTDANTHAPTCVLSMSTTCGSTCSSSAGMASRYHAHLFVGKWWWGWC